MDIRWREVIAIYLVTACIVAVFLSIGQDSNTRYQDALSIAAFFFCALCSTTVAVNACLSFSNGLGMAGRRIMAVVVIALVFSVPGVFIAAHSLLPATNWSAFPGSDAMASTSLP